MGQTMLPMLRDERDIETFEQQGDLKDRIPSTVYEVFQSAAEQFKSTHALSMVISGADDEAVARTSYRELFELVTQTANLFYKLAGSGVGVAYLLPSFVDTHAVLWGAETVGYAVPLNPLLEVDHLIGLLRTSKSSILATCGPSVSPEIWTKVLAIKAALPHLTIVCLQRPPDGEAPSIPCVDFLAERGELDRTNLSFALDRSPHRVVAYFHTGGTTDTPKLVAHTNLNQLTAAFGAASLLAIGANDTITNGMPLFHVGGAIPCSLSFFMVGGHVVMLSPQGLRNPAMVKNFWRIVERQGVTIVGAVPTALGAILSVPLDADLRRVRFGITGSAATPRRVVERFEEVTGKALHELLGMTESAGATAVDPVCAAPTHGSVGYRLPYTRLSVRKRLSDGELGEECAPGEVGVLLVAGPTVSPGYLTAVSGQTTFVDGALNTGDLAYRDAEGKLFIAGRSKDLIIRSGHNIDPAMIEHALLAHPQVGAAAAVGQPDDYAGEIPVCYVSLAEGATVTASDLLEFAKERIGERPAWPKNVYVLSALPLTGVGKVFKPALRADASRRVVMQVLQPIAGETLLDVRVAEGGPRGLRVTVLLQQPTEQVKANVLATLGAFVLDVMVQEVDL